MIHLNLTPIVRINAMITEVIVSAVATVMMTSNNVNYSDRLILSRACPNDKGENDMANKRGQGEGSISKRPDGTWWARITIGKDESGNQLRKAFYGKTRKEVAAKMSAYQEELSSAQPKDFSKSRLAEWMDFWLEHYKKRTVRISTYHNMLNKIHAHIYPALGAIKLIDLKTEMIQKMVNNLHDKGYSRSAIKHCVVFLRGALDQAMKNGLVPKNVATNIDYPQEPRKEMRVLTRDEQARFIAEARNYTIGEMFVLMLATGLRIGEATALTWGDINFEKGCLSVNKTYTHYYDKATKRKVYVISKTKTEAGGRIVPLLPAVAEMLKNRKPDLCSGSDLIFVCENPKCDHTNIKSGSVDHWLQKFLKNANINGEGIHLHTLRHTFATRGFESGIELKVMQELLGHSNISSTADIYTHVLPDKKKDSMMKLADTIAFTDDMEPEGSD